MLGFASRSCLRGATSPSSVLLHRPARCAPCGGASAACARISVPGLACPAAAGRSACARRLGQVSAGRCGPLRRLPVARAPHAARLRACAFAGRRRRLRAVAIIAAALAARPGSRAVSPRAQPPAAGAAPRCPRALARLFPPRRGSVSGCARPCCVVAAAPPRHSRAPPARGGYRSRGCSHPTKIRTRNRVRKYLLTIPAIPAILWLSVHNTAEGDCLS